MRSLAWCPHDETAAAAAAKSLQLCPTLCDPIDGSPPGSAVPGTLQARTLEWVAISFSNTWKWKVKVKSLSHAWLFVTPWTAAYQAPPSMGFSWQEYWSGLPLPSLHDEIISTFLRRHTRMLSLCPHPSPAHPRLLCEDTGRRRPSTGHEDSSHQKLVSLILDL